MKVTDSVFRQINLVSAEARLGCWTRDRAPFLCRLDLGNDACKAEVGIQLDKHWSRSGGRLAVSLFLDDLGYRSRPDAVRPFGSLTMMRLGQLTHGTDHWWEVQTDNIDAVAREVVGLIDGHLVPIARAIRESGDLTKFADLCLIPLPISYYFYKGKPDAGMAILVRRLVDRESGDEFLGEIIRLGQINEAEAGAIRIIQMQARGDQGRQIRDFIKEKGWERYL